jgi:hypothetical protein
MVEGKITEAAASALGGRANLLTPILKPLYVAVALFLAGSTEYVKDPAAKSLIYWITIPVIIICMAIYLINYFRLFGTKVRSNQAGLRSEVYMEKSFANDANKRQIYMQLLTLRTNQQISQDDMDRAWSQMQ